MKTEVVEVEVDEVDSNSARILIILMLKMATMKSAMRGEEVVEGDEDVAEMIVAVENARTRCEMKRLFASMESMM